MSFKKNLMPKIWGGEKLEKFFSCKSFEKNYGESWEISVINDFESVVNNGAFKNKKLDKLIEKYPIEILGSFGIKDEAKLEAKLKKAQEFLDQAMVLSENNAEILITQALLNTAYISFDGQRYGMSLSTKNIILYS